MRVFIVCNFNVIIIRDSFEIFKSLLFEASISKLA